MRWILYALAMLMIFLAPIILGIRYHVNLTDRMWAITYMIVYGALMGASWGMRK
jgi:hypothetical protein